MPFAFTILDDTDFGTVENLAPVYRLLAGLGLRTTKSVWPLAPNGAEPHRLDKLIGGQTLEDPGYLAFVRNLAAEGFEVALHGVSGQSSKRGRVLRGLAYFQEQLDAQPLVHTNHEYNRDNLYWGADRAGSPAVRALYDAATLGKGRRWFEGHRLGSLHFWGDVAKARIRYVRNFAFDELNLNKVNPSLPYHDPRTPYVNYWFSSSDGGNVERFCRLLSEENQDRLEAEEGVCIMYTHFANGFVEDGRVHPRFAALLRRFAAKPGRFVPVSELLDGLLAQRGGAIPAGELAAMEWRWLSEKMRKGTT